MSIIFSYQMHVHYHVDFRELSQLNATSFNETKRKAKEKK